MEQAQEHLTAQEVEHYRKRTMNSDARRRCDRHVAGCDDCLGRVFDSNHINFAVSRITEAFLSSDEEAFHLSQEDFKRYADGPLDEADRTIFDSHLEICQQCSKVATGVPAIKTARQPGIASPLPWQWFLGSGRWPAFAIGIIGLIGCLSLSWVIWRTPNRATQEAAREIGREAPAPPDDEAHTGGPEAPVRGSADLPSDERPSVPVIVVGLRDGGREIGLDGAGNVIGLEGLAPAAQSDVKAALTMPGLKKPQVLADLAGPPIRLMDPSTDGVAFRLTSPIGAVVTRQRPLLRWEPLRGASSYTVHVFDAQFHRVAKSEPQSTTEWLLPIPLRRGAVYSWEVRALRGDLEISAPVAPAPRAQFKVLDRESVSELTGIKKHVPVSHLALGVSYARMGLLDEAERELQFLAKDNPRSPVSSKLLRTVRRWRRR